MYDSWEIPVPGRYLDGVAYLDLETRKVPAKPGFRMANGEPLKMRWSPFLAGVASGGTIRLIERTGDDASFLSGVRMAIGPKDTVVYRATREFDEMILKGRFTNARRAHEEIAFYPAMPDAEELTWDCRKPDPEGIWESMRKRELASRDVSATYERYGARRATLVLIHLLRDVCELIGAYGEPDERCAMWLWRVLTDDAYAYDVVFGGEPEDS